MKCFNYTPVIHTSMEYRFSVLLGIMSKSSMPIPVAGAMSNLVLCEKHGLKVKNGRTPVRLFQDFGHVRYLIGENQMFSRVDHEDSNSIKKLFDFRSLVDNPGVDQDRLQLFFSFIERAIGAWNKCYAAAVEIAQFKGGYSFVPLDDWHSFRRDYPLMTKYQKRDMEQSGFITYVFNSVDLFSEFVLEMKCLMHDMDEVLKPFYVLKQLKK